MAIHYRTKDLHGIINVYKEKGFTSHDVVAVIRKVTGAKAGHTGTLDPDAEGVLPICLGKATKLAGLLAANNKVYNAELILGVVTDTRDASGTVLSERPVTASQDDVVAAAASFVGDILQTPPMYSAIKVDGKKMYELARAGEEIDLEPRAIHIDAITVTGNPRPNVYRMEIACGKGTYIRSLCHDIGEKLGCGAHMGALLRTRNGRFHLSQSHKLAAVKAAAYRGRIQNILLPMTRALSDLKSGKALEAITPSLHNGQPVNMKNVTFDRQPDIGELCVLFDYAGQLVGLYTAAGNERQPSADPETPVTLKLHTMLLT